MIVPAVRLPACEERRESPVCRRTWSPPAQQPEPRCVLSWAAALMFRRASSCNGAFRRTVPTVRRARSERAYSRIDFVERKKTTAVIQGELDDARMRTEAYRPAHVRPIGESEKERGFICGARVRRRLSRLRTGHRYDRR